MMILPASLALGACAGPGGFSGTLGDLMKSQPGRFGAVLENAATHRVQAIYTQIDRDEANRPSFRSLTYRLNAGEYFYPASTVKLPVSLLALEKINELGIEGLTRDSALLTGVAAPSQTPAGSDATAPGGLPSVGHYIRKILLVSDNDAFNRLYEFLGQEPLNARMHALGYTGSRIVHRLSVALSVEDNRRTNPVAFVENGQTVFVQPPLYSGTTYTAPAPILLGRAEIVGGERLERPKDFADKNAYPLQEQHDVIRALLFPESVPPDRRFGLTQDDYRFVYRNMSRSPTESGIPAYATTGEDPAAFDPRLVFGDDSRNARIFNKSGQAYGFLTDAAYFADFDNGIEFILAATVYANANGTFNDDDYEYDTVGKPFLNHLARAVYEIELARERPRRPDLGRFADLGRD